MMKKNIFDKENKIFENATSQKLLEYLKIEEILLKGINYVKEFFIL